MAASSRAPGGGTWFWKRLLPLLVWTGGVLWIASRPKSVFTLQGSTHILGVPRHLLQYPYHAGAFFGLAFLMFRCFASRPVGWSPRRAAVSAWLGSALVSLLSEVIQFNVPGRSFTVKDLLLDLTGATAAVVLARAKRAAFQRG